ncbi:unnamed protein product, partial [Adineta ricciae]
MSRKPVKSNVTKSKVAAKPSPPASSAVETQVKVEKFKHDCATENFNLVWLDENYDEMNSNCSVLTAKLSTIIRNLYIFNDVDECIKRINSIRDLDVYLILSNPTEDALAHTHQLGRVKVVFIFDDRNSSNPSWKGQWKK